MHIPSLRDELDKLNTCYIMNRCVASLRDELDKLNTCYIMNRCVAPEEYNCYYLIPIFILFY